MRSFKPPKTTRFERLLLATVIVLLPLENNYVIGGFSLSFILFGVILVFAGMRHPKTLLRTALHPVFLMAYLFLLYSAIMEGMHINSDYEVVNRTAQMVAGGVVIASYCRDPKALRTTMYSFLVMGGGLAIYLLLTIFGVLSVTASAEDMESLNFIRKTIYQDQFLENNINTIASHVALGPAVALVLLTTSKKMSRRIGLIGTFLICITGIFMPMSRSGIFIAMVLCVLIMFLRGVFRLRTLVLGLAVAFIILFVVPEFAFSRMSFSFEPSKSTGQPEGRAQVILASIHAISEEPLLGVGAGNFWGQWGLWSGFYALRSKAIIGAHNAFFQIIIYWGVFSCLIWIFMYWMLYRRLPQPLGSDRASLFLFTLFMWLSLLSLFTHNIYKKSFALILGVIIGFDLWIRPYFPLNSLGYKGRSAQAIAQPPGAI